MAGISSKALEFGGAENKKKYNGIEKENDLSIEMYDAQLRDLDGQIGRWWEIDPKTENMEMWSPYASNYNNPIRFSDPLGDEGQDCCWEELKGIFNQMGENFNNRMGYAKGVVSDAVDQAGSNFRARRDAGMFTTDGILQTVYDNFGPFSGNVSLGPAGSLVGMETRLLSVEYRLATTEVKMIGDAEIKTILNSEKQAVGKASQAAKPVELYEAGLAKDLQNRSLKDGPDIHHAPQGQPAGQLFPGFK